MSIIFTQADSSDIDELIRMRIDYMIDDFGSISEVAREAIKRQLPDYFARKLGTELVAFVAKDDNKVVSVAYLHIIEMPANSLLLNGLYGEVLSVYTEPEYRRQGLCTKLIEMLVAYGRDKGLGRIDLGATNKGYPVYKKVGFKDKEARYKAMQYKFD